MEENELFGEAHEQEENGLFGRIHQAEQLNLCGVGCSFCEEIPKYSFYLGRTCEQCNKPFRVVKNNKTTHLNKDL